MSNNVLQRSANTFIETIQKKQLAPTTIRNYEQKMHAILSFCAAHGIETFSYDVAKLYASHLEERVGQGEIGEKYAGFLRGLAYAFADFLSSPPGTYTYMSHQSFTSSSNTLDVKSKGVYSAFYDYLVSLQYAPDSIRGHLIIVAPFLHYLNDREIPLDCLSPQDVRDYLVYVSPSRAKSMDSVLDGIRAFLRYLADEECISWSIDLIKFHTPHSRKKVPVAYSAEELNDIFSVINRTTPTGKRDYAIIILSLYTGLRSVDIRHLKISDIKWECDQIHIVQHKTNRELITPLLPVVGNSIADYILNGRPDSDNPYVFLMHGRGCSGQPMGAGVIINRMRLYLLKAGVKKNGNDGKDFHAVRKTFATNLLLSGTPLESVASALGDAGVQAAKPYLALDNENLRVCCPAQMKHPCHKEGLHA